jgi:predicted dehydrogenase
MKFLVIGLGSMGKRRIRCLKELGYEDIIGFDLKEERNYFVDIQTFIKFSDAMKEKPDVFLICTPPNHHFQYMDYAIRYNIPCFVEASVCIGGMRNLLEKDINHLIHPSATMRFNWAIKDIHNFMKKWQEITYFDYYCSSWLPDWHPNEDILDFYVSKKETGACREIVPFELEWLIWVFGRIKKIKSIIKNTNLFGEIDDIYEILIEFESGIIGHVRIDVVSRFGKGGRRELMLNGDTSYKWTIYIEEEIYIEEIKHFIESLETKQYHYSLQDDIKVLELLKQIEN